MSFKSLSPFLRSWTCRACLQKSTPVQPFRSRRVTYATESVKILPKPRRRGRLVVAGTGVVLAGTAVTFSDDAQHVVKAAQRTGRVVSTLFVCINDYRVTLKHEHDNPEDYNALLKACHKRCAERTLVAMQKNGSIFIKLGQHLSSLTYLLPVEWCDTFLPLQDKCPISSFESIEAMVLKDTGAPLEEFFEEFAKEPIGAASLAQVHVARIKGTGEKVAVKVQHPSLDEWAPLDLRLTAFTFSTLKRWFPEYDLTWLSEEMEVSLPQELDFALEGKNALHAKEYFSKVKDAPVVIPNVLWAKRRILVMEFVSGHRPDDLKWLDENGIDRDEVSASLARIFNEMIFGTNAPLHCDPHGGNIAIRHNPKHGRKQNFDIILYDHGLYRNIPMPIRRSYAKLWLAVLNEDVPRMRQYAYEVGGIDDEYFPLFSSAITGRDYTILAGGGGVAKPKSVEEKKGITDAMGEGMLQQLVELLGKVPRVLLLILKTNDLTRQLDEGLQTRQGPARTFMILARYASRTVYEEQLEGIKGSILWPKNFFMFLEAWWRYTRVGLRLSTYETYLELRRFVGLGPLVVL